MHVVRQAKSAEHVGPDSVCAQRDRVGETPGVGVSDAVAEVGSRIVKDRALQVMVGGEMDTMRQEPVRPGEMAQPQRRFYVFRTFTDVDMHPDSEIGGKARCRLEGFIRTGE